MQRRFAWRNERVLHRNVCAKTGKKIITGFAPDSDLKVYDREIWWSDDWDPMAYGKDYIFNQPYSKDDYHKKVQELEVNTYTGLKEAREKFEALKRQQIRKYATFIKCERCTGDNMQNVADSKICFDVLGDA